MKHIYKFDDFGKKSKLNESWVGEIFTSDYDEILNKIFLQIKDNFNEDNLTEHDVLNKNTGFIEPGILYKLENGDILYAREGILYTYTIEINDEYIDCSFLLARKIYNFLEKKRDIKYKEIDSQKIKDERERKLKKYELDKQDKLDRLSKLKSKYNS